MSLKPELTQEEQYLFDSIIAARQVQEFLWGKYNDKWDLEEWKRMYRKRWAKIDEIDAKNPHYMIELKKRILQNAALSIAMLVKIENNEIQEACEVPSNLPGYAEKSKFCYDDCQHLSLTEAQQNKQEKGKYLDHVCKLYKERVRHNGHHSRLIRLRQCDYIQKKEF